MYIIRYLLNQYCIMLLLSLVMQLQLSQHVQLLLRINSLPGYLLTIRLPPRNKQLIEHFVHAYFLLTHQVELLGLVYPSIRFRKELVDRVASPSNPTQKIIIS